MANYNLERFIDAQNISYATALAEIKAGKKTSHWIWYIFPQLQGLGYSRMSRAYAISGIEEARAYLADDILLKHLVEISEALLEHKGKTAFEIVELDDVKLKSSMTLFALASGEKDTVFHNVLDTFFDGEMDERTVSMLSGMI